MLFVQALGTHVIVAYFAFSTTCNQYNFAFSWQTYRRHAAAAVTTCNSNKAAAFITMIVVCGVATNQGRLLFTVQRLTK